MIYWIIAYIVVMGLILGVVYWYKKNKKKASINKPVKNKPVTSDPLADLESGDNPVLSVPVNEPSPVIRPIAPIEPIIITQEALQKVVESHSDKLIIPGVEFSKPTFEDVVIQGFEKMNQTLIALQNEIDALKVNDTSSEQVPEPKIIGLLNNDNLPVKKPGRVWTEEQKKALAEKLKAGRESAKKKAEQVQQEPKT
jgi:hypothetical protein